MHRIKQPTEREEQILVIEYLEMLKKTNKILFFYAIPNGGSRNSKEALNMKKEGVRPGVSDLCVIAFHKILYIEMKKRANILKNGNKSTSRIHVSDLQKEFIATVTKNPNIKAKICYGFVEAKEFIDSELYSRDDSCDGCKDKPTSRNQAYPIHCGSCSRFYEDKFEEE